jgi:hypothetical protein
MSDKKVISTGIVVDKNIEFDSWLENLENQEQPETQTCSLDNEDCEACGS